MNELTKCIYLSRLSSLEKVKNSFDNYDMFNKCLSDTIRFLHKYRIKDEQKEDSQTINRNI